VRDVSQGTIRPTVDISPSVIASSGAVDVDVRTQRPSQPHFVAGDTRKFLPIHVDVHSAPLTPLSSCVDSHAHSKRLYAAAHAPLAPPTTPVVDLLCHEHNILSSSSDSDYPPASQRENRPPLLGTRLCNPSGSSDLSTATGADALKQSLQLTTQLAATVQQQLERTQTEAAQREHRIFNDIAEREHRLLADAAEREQRLLSAAAARDRRAGELEAQREQILVRDAQSSRQELLADIQLQRDREAQREIDMRRDLYDLSRQSSRAAALEAELKCLKAHIGPPTVAPVQPDDIPPPEVNTADALTWNPNATDISTVYGGHATGISTLRPPCLSSAVDEPTTQYTEPQLSDPGCNLGYIHQSDTLPRWPTATFPRS